MRKISELDEAQLRHEFRELYREQGTAVSLQVLYELVLSVNILCSVLLEEKINKRV